MGLSTSAEEFAAVTLEFGDVIQTAIIGRFLTLFFNATSQESALQ